MKSSTFFNICVALAAAVWIALPAIVFAGGAFLDAPQLAPSRLLEFGMAGEDVQKLQRLLAADPALYPEGLITGYFGSRTRRAVEWFQIRHGIANASDGLAARTGFGRFGPRTRAKIFEIVQFGGKEGMRLMPQDLKRP